MIDTDDRRLEIVFVKDQKQFIQTFSKKQKCDYLLNVNKIIKEKFEQEILVPNKIQSFLINYEIKKLLDKAITVKNEKYNQIIYLNSNLSTVSILNTIDFISEEYPDFDFAYHLISPTSDPDPIEVSNKLIEKISS